MKEWVAGRGSFGASDNLLQELPLEDPAGYMYELRMDKVTVEELLALISPAIKKQDTVMRSSISRKTKLEIILRFLKVATVSAPWDCFLTDNTFSFYLELCFP